MKYHNYINIKKCIINKFKKQYKNMGLVLCEEIGDGNINNVYKIKGDSACIIVKQALPYLKIAGDEWPLTVSRNLYEFRILEIFWKCCCDLIPKVYYVNKEKSYFFMEYCDNMYVLRDYLISGGINNNLSKEIANFLSCIYSHSYRYIANQEDGFFKNSELCNITERLVFTDPFYNCKTNDISVNIKHEVERIWEDEKLIRGVEELKRIFLNKKEALIHGDLHTGSIFINNHCKIFDCEFSFYGPISFDIGTLLGNLVINYIYYRNVVEDNFEYEKYILRMVKEIWNYYCSNLYKQINDKCNIQLQRRLSESFIEMIGFSGCEIIRRVIGMAHVKELDVIKDINKKKKVEIKCIKMGMKFIKERSDFSDINEYIEYIEYNSR